MSIKNNEDATERATVNIKIKGEYPGKEYISTMRFSVAFILDADADTIGGLIKTATEKLIAHREKQEA